MSGSTNNRRTEPLDPRRDDIRQLAADDPVVVRLELLVAQLPVPTDTLDRLQRTLIAHYAETMATAGQRRGRRFAWPHVRRILAVGFAAVLLLGTVAGAAAYSGPGQPFYHVRLTIEDITLPPPGSRDRLDAQIGLLTRRLTEATYAASTGDAAATADAAGAYADRVEAAVGDFVSQRTPQPLADFLEDQEHVLAGIIAQAPPEALDAIEIATAAVSAAQDQLAQPLPGCPSTLPAPPVLAGSPVVSGPPPSSSAAAPATASASPSSAASGLDPDLAPVAPSCPPVPSARASLSPTGAPSPMQSPEPTDSPRPTASPTSSPTPEPSPTPEQTPGPTPEPKPVPTAVSTPTPTPVPTPIPTPVPTPVATPIPTPVPTPIPPPSTDRPTQSPSGTDASVAPASS